MVKENHEGTGCLAVSGRHASLDYPNVIHSQPLPYLSEIHSVPRFNPLLESTEESPVEIWRMTRLATHKDTAKGQRLLALSALPLHKASVRPSLADQRRLHRLRHSSELARPPCLITLLPPSAFHPLANVHLVESPDDAGTLPLLLCLIKL